MLNIIGTGLNVNDISLSGLRKLQESKIIYLEGYTSLIHTTLDEMESIYKIKILPVCREFLESTDKIFEDSTKNEVSLLVIGTPFFATTHSEFLIRAREYNVKVNVIHNSGIQNVMGIGFFSYNFGRTVSIPFFTDDWKPLSFYDKIISNITNKLHTLVLLDIKISKCSECKCDTERINYFDGNFKKINQQNNVSMKLMTANIAIEQILEASKMKNDLLITPNTTIAVICRFGSPSQQLYFDRISNLLLKDFGEPLHALIIPSDLEIIEKEHIENLYSRI